MNVEGIKTVLGLWIEQTEGAKFWLRVMTELKNRGVADILIAAVDGLKGFPEAITSVFPPGPRSRPASYIWCVTACALCPGKTVRKWPSTLKAIYRAETESAAQGRLSEFEAKWDGKYPTIGQSWRRNWEQVIPFLGLSPGNPQGDLHHQCHRELEPQSA